LSVLTTRGTDVGFNALTDLGLDTLTAVITATMTYRCQQHPQYTLSINQLINQSINQSFIDVSRLPSGPNAEHRQLQVGIKVEEEEEEEEEEEFICRTEHNIIILYIMTYKHTSGYQRGESPSNAGRPNNTHIQN